MANYKVEGNISFYDELFKSLDYDTDDEDTLCQITGLKLINRYVTLECKHKFNYEALYKEICRQKFDFKTYDFNILPKKEQHKIKSANVNYFIKCPYCRNIQFTVLPYYEELKLEKKYGINCLDKELDNKTEDIYKNTIYSGIHYGHEHYSFNMYGVQFKNGKCCGEILGVNTLEQTKTKCTYKYVAQIENTELFYCKYCYKKGLKEYNTNKKMKLLEEKKKQKDDIINVRKKLFDEKNAEREAKGLPPLKRLIIKKKIANEVKPAEPIGEYVPDQDEEIENQTNGCKSILKTGLNKGKECGCKKINDNGFCIRHSKKLEENKNIK